jgi:PAS domain S-box-containing protein
MSWLGALVIVLGCWVVLLRRRVRELNQAVRQQLDHHIALDERLAELTNNVSDAVYALDLHGRFTAVNLAAERVTGWRRAELLRGSIFDLIVADRHDDARRWLQHAAASKGRGDMRFETTINGKGGATISLSGRFHVITQQGIPAGFEGVAHVGRDEATTGAQTPANELERQLVA